MMRSAAAGAVIARFPKVKVLVAGDLMLDTFIWGTVERISPEAPVPVVQVTEESRRLGGSANVINNIRALGGRAVACGVVGADLAGRQLVADLRRIGADTSGVMQGRDAATTRKTRIIAHQQQVVRLDREQPPHRDSRAAARARGYLLAYASRADVVILSDYGKGLITPPLLAALAGLRAAAAQRSKAAFRLIIDPKRGNFEHYRGASLVTPNQGEASQASGVEIRDTRSLLRAGAELLERWQAEAVLVTRGEHGMSLFVPGKAARHIATAARHVYDVTGAGDTVIATCALALASGASLETAAVLANHAAGIVVGEVGTATVSAAELKRAAVGGRRAMR